MVGPLQPWVAWALSPCRGSGTTSHRVRHLLWRQEENLAAESKPRWPPAHLRPPQKSRSAPGGTLCCCAHAPAAVCQIPLLISLRPSRLPLLVHPALPGSTQHRRTTFCPTQAIRAGRPPENQEPGEGSRSSACSNSVVAQPGACHGEPRHCLVLGASLKAASGGADGWQVPRGS